MTEPRKKPGWVFWTVVALMVPVLYVASFGPACWGGKRVLHLIDADRGGLNHVDLKVARTRIAGGKGIRQALQQAPAVFAVEHPPKAGQVGVDPSHLDRLVDLFMIGGGEDDFDAVDVVTTNVGLGRQLRPRRDGVVRS